MDLGLSGKVAIVTGGASGIGLAVADYLARDGAKLLLGDFNQDALASAIARIKQLGSVALGQRVDVRSYEDCEELVDRARREFGAVDILVNSAGIAGPMSFFAETEIAQWDDLLDTNLRGVMHCCRAVMDVMITQASGRIVNLASEAGKGNEKRMVVYGVTKGGVISLTRGLAAELGRYNITVNAVCPGVVRTAMTGFITDDMERDWARLYLLGRLGRPQDVASLVTFLASREASWITGQAISVNGGFSRS